MTALYGDMKKISRNGKAAAKETNRKAYKSGRSTYAVVAVNPNMFSYYVEVKASSLEESVRLSLKKLSKKYPEEIFSRVEAELIE